MSRRVWSVIFLLVLAVGGTAYLAFLAGANRAKAASTLVSAAAVKAEEECFRTSDAECFRASWFLRAGLTAQSAQRALDGSIPSAIEAELRSYLRWAEQLPKVYTPAK